jgi:hypothetical protein
MPVFDASLTTAEWRTRREEYRERARPRVADRLRRSSRQQAHPVYDFLFEYYSFRPSYLMRWSPGPGVRLEGASRDDLDWQSWFRPCPGGHVLPGRAFPARRAHFLAWAIAYLESTGNREPYFGCFGLHEWAMVYREPDVRHRRIPLRLTRDETDAVVEASVLCCTHYDAYRFFSPDAAPRNRLRLDRASTPEHDQPGCVHVTMDLYKWAYAIAPYIASELVADAFELAVAARELDMRASPYDLRGLGFEPIAIETRAGRDAYVEGQRELYRRAVAVRRRVLDAYRRLASFVADHEEGRLAKSAEKNPIASS